jgi:hypothetical protein
MRDAGQQEACPVWRTYTDDALSAPIVPAMASDRSSGKVRSSCAAMLTGMVTIAVFAAFWPCVMGALLSMPNSSGFAPRINLTFRVMGGKSGKKRQRNGTVGGKNGKDAR